MSRLGRCALAYASRGWQVFPLVPRTKRPATTHGFQDASTDDAVVRAWWDATPEANVGLATGPGSGVWVLDIDGPVGATNLWWWEARHGALVTLASRTGREDGGRQLFFKWPEGRCIKNATGILPGLDVRADGGYVVLPPSVHPDSGKEYRWEAKGVPQDAPEDLLRMVGARTTATATATVTATVERRPVATEGTTAYGQAVLDGVCSELAATGRGARDHQAFRAAIRLTALELGGEIAPGVIEGELRAALARCGYMDDPRRERGEAGLQRILRSARERATPERGTR